MIRRAVEADCDALVRLAADGAARWRAEDFRGSMVDEEFVEKVLFVCEEQGSVTGFVAGSFLVGEDAATLSNVAVAVAWRRRGVAATLVGALRDWVEERGVKALELEVRAGNVAAQAAYAAMGFVQTGVRERYYAGPVEDGLLMRCRVGRL